MKKFILLILLLGINNYAQTKSDPIEVFPVFPICKLLPDSKYSFEAPVKETEAFDGRLFLAKVVSSSSASPVSYTHLTLPTN